jgi:autotransporter-associated beta strand protein
MKKKANRITEESARNLFSMLAVVSICLGLGELAQAQGPSELFWDGPGEIPSMVEGGNGFWSNATSELANWCTDDTGQVNIPWIDGSVAVFQGTAGTVTVTDTIIFGGMKFHTDGYQIVSDGAIDSILQLMGSPTITTDAGVTATIDATLAGAGGITKEGLGTLILSGTNSYLGSTTIDAGSLIVDGSISGAQTSVNNGGRLVVNVDGSISSAQTSVNNGGSLIVDGLISSPETLVNLGGSLSGNGSLGGNLTNSGIVSPGNSPGTLTIAGDYTQTTSGTLKIEVAGLGAGNHDLLVVGDTATLAGTLQVVRLNNFKFSPGNQVTFLTAGDVNGTFNPVINPFAISGTIVKVQVVYLPTGVSLVATQGSFKTVCDDPNSIAVGAALDREVADQCTAGVIRFLDSEPLSDLCRDLADIAPDELTSIFATGVSLANIQSVNLQRRMADIRAGSRGFSAKGLSLDSRVADFSPDLFSPGLAGPTGPEGKSGPSVMQPTPENRWGVFVTGLGEFTSVDNTSIVPGYNLSTGGLTFGADYRVSPNFAIGLTGGYAHTNADLVNSGSLDVDGGTIGAYATGFASGFYADAAAFGVFNGIDDHRSALLGTASGDTDGRDFNALVAAGYDWNKGALTIGPTVSYQYTYVEFDGFTEQGSLAPLTFGGQNANSSRTALGAKASYDWHVGHIVVKPELRAAWQHEFGDTDYSIVSRFANCVDNSFRVTSPAIGRDSLLIGAGAAVMFNDRVSVNAYYDGELARTNYSSNNVSAGLRFTF